ncbi:MAG: ArnT family glycosyltransferase, partial [Anaerolineales bacterium]
AGDFAPELAQVRSEPAPWDLRRGLLVSAAALSFLTYLTSGGNQFRGITLLAWAGSLLAVVAAFWDGEISLRAYGVRWRAWLAEARNGWRVEPWPLVVLAGLAVCAYFRFAHLDQVPREMVSDHAEKLLDVVDVLRGGRPSFFPRNTGREAIQFYLAAGTAVVLGTGVSFLTLKIGSALAGWLTLPYLYGLGRELAGRGAGLAAMLLAGIGYWPNVIGRSGLRFPLYPLFAAPAIYYFVRGVRRRSRNDLLLCGLFTGLGMHGYTPIRVLPLALGVGLVLAWLHKREAADRRTMGAGMLAAAAVALAAAMPLVRVGVDSPENVFLRTLTRIGTIEQPLPGPAPLVFLSNLWNALRMFAWDNGDIWVISIPHRPALDWVTGALFHLGAAAAVVRYARRKSWPDLYLLLLVPLLMLPSILSLAFPAENPAPNRAAGAMIPVFVLAGIFLADLAGWARARFPGKVGTRIGLGAAGVLAALAALVNFQLVFGAYADQHRRAAWNTRDAGRIVRAFADSIGSLETAHVVAFPHWMDTRLVGIVAGDPTRDYAIWPDQLGSLLPEQRAQLFLVNPADSAAVERLRALFPGGQLQLWPSAEDGHDLLIYWVPPRTGVAPP